jgi:RND family efflux transporter MFP subunit
MGLPSGGSAVPTCLRRDAAAPSPPCRQARAALKIGRAVAFCASLAAGLVGGCKKENAYVAPPPPQVGVAHPIARAVVPYLEATGSTVAYNEVDLVARVEGFVESIDYKDGTEATPGQSLFVIEPPPYQAKLQQAQASLAAAKAQFTQADTEFARQSALGRRDFASQAAVDQARATRDTDQANVANQQAGLALAAINLGYTRVTAPFAGVVTQHLVSVGDLVGVSGPTRLASIVQLDPIYVTFSISEQDVQRIRANLVEAGVAIPIDLSKVPVEAGLMSEPDYPHRGVLDYVAPEVDPATGTLIVRAVFENQQRVLRPGYFVRIRLPERLAPAPALLVADASLGTSQAGRYLLVVNKDDVVEQRTVRAGALDGGLRVVQGEVTPDDRVVVTGLARAIPGEKVAPTPVAMPGG